MGKKELNFELNLAPCLDIFSTLIVILLSTTAWMQINVLSSNTSNVTAADPSEAQSQPEPPKKEKKVNLAVTIMTDRVDMVEEEKPISVTHKNGEIDLDKVSQILKNWRKHYPNKKDIVIHTDNQIPYKHMITMFDALVGNDWPDVGVSTQ